MSRQLSLFDWEPLKKELSKGARRVLDLMRWYLRTFGKVFPKQSKIAERLQCGVRSIKRWVDELKQAGAIEKVELRGPTSALYILRDVEIPVDNLEVRQPSRPPVAPVAPAFGTSFPAPPISVLCSEKQKQATADPNQTQWKTKFLESAGNGRFGIKEIVLDRIARYCIALGITPEFANRTYQYIGGRVNGRMNRANNPLAYLAGAVISELKGLPRPIKKPVQSYQPIPEGVYCRGA